MMNKFELIYNEVKEKKVKVTQHKPIIIISNDRIFTSKSLANILGQIKFIKKYYGFFEKSKTIVLRLGKVDFADKITYLLLDTIIYDLVKNTKFRVNIEIDVNLSHIINQGVKSTAMYRASNHKTGFFDKDLFIKIYEEKVSLEEDYYRRYITRESLENNLQLPSIIVTDISYFLKMVFDDGKWIEEVCEVVGELLDNAFFHTEGDCLIDIDLCNANDKEQCEYKFLNIAVINFSENRIFDKIKYNITEEKYSKEDDLYKNVYEAYANHKKYFSERYKEDDFFQITAFQNGVTSRTIKSGHSGKGLTSLIKNIMGKTHESYSYVLSGKNILYFKEEYLDIHSTGFIGFNQTSDYITSKPDDEVILKSDLYIPGTIFHLSLIRKEG